MPPQKRSSMMSVLSDRPNGTSYRPGRFTWPDTHQIFGPRLPMRPRGHFEPGVGSGGTAGVPTLFHHSRPLPNIRGRSAIVSTLLTIVGRAHAPLIAGNGGLRRG